MTSSFLLYRDALLISFMDVITSIIAGFVIFTTFGGMAKKIGVDVEDVAKGGYGLAFVAYPEALSNLPPNQLWSILFFFMLFTLGLDSEVRHYTDGINGYVVLNSVILIIKTFINESAYQIYTYIFHKAPNTTWFNNNNNMV